MKNIIIVLISLFAATSFAAGKKSGGNFTREYGLAGCGLGAVLIGKSGGQIFAATTNGSFSNQWFGISAGSLNCVDSPSAEVAGRMDQFIIANRAQVQGDIARGNGETIAALGSYMGCKATTQQVGGALKANYSNIFDGKKAANELTDNVISTILANPELAKECGNLG
jgi:hypothetical protein